MCKRGIRFSKMEIPVYDKGPYNQRFSKKNYKPNNFGLLYFLNNLTHV